ncbi:MAG: hypothetical protein KDK08_15835 [Rhizobiaceae bacterium]|nr:hypothetical protein [Rhizobiaceae bacterium]
MLFPDLERLKNARDKAAQIVLQNPHLLPVFERLEAEVEAAEATGDALARARALAARQRAIA